MLSIDHHILAGLSIGGSMLDVLGGLYLAYDLLGGQHGPLRTLTRAVTYGVLFGLGVYFPLGLWVAIVIAIGNGATLGIEFEEAARGRLRPPLRQIILFSAIRGVAFGLSGAILLGTTFGLVFGTLSWAGQIFAYRIGFGPTAEYASGRRPKFSRRRLLGTLNRTVGYMLNGLISGAVSHRGRAAIGFSVAIGLSIGAVSALLSVLVPFIEWWADNLPERRLGVIGAVLVVTGFSLQSLQYRASLLDVHVR